MHHRIELFMQNRLEGTIPPALFRGLMIVCAVALFAHWPALLSDSVMWDDWIVLGCIRERHADWLIEFYRNYGVTPYAIVHLPFFALTWDMTHVVGIAKAVYLLSAVASSCLIASLAFQISGRNVTFATMTGCLAASYPGWSGEAIHISVLVYSIFILMFFVGMLLFIGIASRPERRSMLIRATALALLFISFALNSLLTLFYGLFPIVVYAAVTEVRDVQQTFWKNIARFLGTNFDFVVLPLIFWVFKETFMPRVGQYVRYNQIHLSIPGLMADYARLVPDTLRATIKAPFSFSLGIALAIASFTIAVLGRRRVLRWLTDHGLPSRATLWILFAAGAFALASTALPYYLVGRHSFLPFGYGTRDNALFPISYGMSAAALFCLCLWFIRRGGRAFSKLAVGHARLGEGAVAALLAALIIAQSVANWRNVADWQAHYVYYRSTIEKIARLDLARRASIIQVSSRLPSQRTLQSVGYPTSIWTEIIAAGFGKTERLATPYPPENGKFYTRPEIDHRVYETEVQFMLANINLGGRQIRVDIDPGSGATGNISLAFNYWRARFWKPAEMAPLLESVTRIHAASLQAPTALN